MKVGSILPVPPRDVGNVPFKGCLKRALTTKNRNYMDVVRDTQDVDE